LKSKNFAQLK